MIIYLCVKTHSITGLKYLCQTKKKDPFKYSGSGVDWIKHLKVHGYCHQTEIIRECETHAELSQWGRYYSSLWNIVTAQYDYGNKIWANRIPETGGGSGAMPGKNNPMHGITGKIHPCSRNQSGMNNERADHTVYVWKNIHTGEQFNMTRWEFKQTGKIFKTGVDRLARSELNQYKGWKVIK